MLTTAYIGIGSNMKDPMQQVCTALKTLATLPGCTLVSQSSMYSSDAVGPGQQDSYINAVAELNTEYSAADLLKQLQAIEAAHGRVRKQRWGPRPLDLDILLFGNQIISTSTLSVPHPELNQRHFVLYPLAEIAPELILPDGRSMPELLKECAIGELLKVEG
ncbi:MAG: 2-amino-4-hydroxy-6-hydroxymethyldihydropteridine diphosphokinase [Pseudomonadales bacterium]|nr:2-amino-4-hydroxy-6-hydroxymethyldihydropteridine diphosphokinase [Pseudomonadales bacterium]